MVYPLPRHPGSNGPPGPYFDGRHLHNATNNPYLNTLFEHVNATQDMIEFAPIGSGYGYGGGYNANLAFLNNFIDPVVGNAAHHYRAGLQTAQNAGHGGGGGEERGIGGSLFGFAGDVAGGILRIPSAPLRWIGLDALADITDIPGNLVEGLWDAGGSVVDAILPF